MASEQSARERMLEQAEAEIRLNANGNCADCFGDDAAPLEWRHYPGCYATVNKALDLALARIAELERERDEAMAIVAAGDELVEAAFALVGSEHPRMRVELREALRNAIDGYDVAREIEREKEAKTSAAQFPGWTYSQHGDEWVHESGALVWSDSSGWEWMRADEGADVETEPRELIEDAMASALRKDEREKGSE